MTNYVGKSQIMIRRLSGPWLNISGPALPPRGDATDTGRLIQSASGPDGAHSGPFNQIGPAGRKRCQAATNSEVVDVGHGSWFFPSLLQFPLRFDHLLDLRERWTPRAATSLESESRY